MAKVYPALAFADYFIEKALADNKNITNMTVLKLLYFVQGFGFQRLDCRLIKEDFYAWQWGPVIKEVYDFFKSYGSSPIRSISGIYHNELQEIKNNPTIIEILDKLYVLVDINPFVLSEKTHIPGGPWSKTNPYQKIDVELIKHYFVQ